MVLQNKIVYLFLAIVLLVSAGCQFIDPDYRQIENLLKKQKMTIAPYSDYHSSRHGSGFGVEMKQEVAIQMGAPTSIEFRDALEKQLGMEAAQGHVYCPSGYKIGTLRHFMHYYTTIEVDCIQDR